MAAISRIESNGQLVEGILIRPNGKGTFLLEVVEEEARSLGSRVTKHPVEDGTQISDHIILENKTISVNVIISDASFITGVDKTQDAVVNVPSLGPIDFLLNHLGFIEQFFDNAIDRTPVVTTGAARFTAISARSTLEEMRDNREVLTLRTSIADYENVAITSIRTTRNKDKSSRMFEFTLKLEQIQVVGQAASISFVEKRPDVQDEASALKESGKQGTKEVDQSVLIDLVATAKKLIGGE